MVHINCIVCGRREARILARPYQNGHRCNNCRIRRRELGVIQIPNPLDNAADADIGDVPNNIDVNREQLTWLSLPTSHRRCCVCGLVGEGHQYAIPERALIKIWIDDRIFINTTNRTCREHLIGEVFNNGARQSIIDRAAVRVISIGETRDLLVRLTNKITESQRCVDFEKDTMTSSDYKVLTALHKPQFDELFTICNARINPSVHMGKRNSLGILLMKMRLNIPHRALGILFGLKFCNAPRISEIITNVIQAIESTFLVNNLGFDTLSRDQWLNHGALLDRFLYQMNEGSLCFFIDATYLYGEKSTNHSIQKSMFNAQKQRNLLKYCFFVTGDGTIIDIKGPYPTDGKNNDSSILNSMIFDETENSFFRNVEANDVVVCDRGYRDSRNLLEGSELNVFIPPFIRRGERQFDTLTANEARRISIRRWVVEATFGRIKKVWKIYRDNVHNNYALKVSRMLKISAGLSNFFFAPLRVDQESDIELADKVLRLMNQPNNLQIKVQEQRLAWGNARWEIAFGEDDLEDFPRLTIDQVESLTLGCYQIVQARSYTQAHRNNNNNMFRTQKLFEEYNEDSCILRSRLPSRFTSSVNHWSFVEYRPNANTEDSILGWYCQCKTGARTVVMCSHISTVIWYMAYARHHQDQDYPTQELSDNWISANADVNNIEDNSENDDIDDE